MTKSSPEPSPVPIRRYRYSKLRWRVSVRAIDLIGAVFVWLWRLFRPIPGIEAPRRILIIQLDHLGDAVLTSPLPPLLRRAYPQALIDVLASLSNQAVFQADPHIDRVHVAPRNWFERRPGAWAIWTALWELSRLLRREPYQLGIDVRGDVLSVLLMALAGIPRRVGWFMGGGGFLLTDVAGWCPGRHEVRSRLALLERLGLQEPDPVRVSVYPSDRDRARVARLLHEAWPPCSHRVAFRRLPIAVGAAVVASLGSRTRTLPTTRLDPDLLHAGRFGEPQPLMAVHLGAGTAAKRWPTTHWRALVARFLGDGWRIVVVGGPEDADASKGLPPHPDLRDWTGQLALTETAVLLERADFFIGADSGPAHLAACAGVPSVVLFSGTNQSRQWRPWSRRSLVLKHRVPCRPCHQKQCPLQGHPCMSGIHPDRVYRAARRWWSRLHHSEAPHAPI
jgi:heptosyltransferase-2